MDLTDRPIDRAAADQAIPQRSGDALLARALGRARWSILWERVWPPLAAIATVVGLFLAVSWLGVWLMLPPIGRAIGIGLFFLLTAAAFAPLLIVRLPSKNDRLRRLDRNSHLPHRAATTLRAGRPVPALAKRDPYALRALVLMSVIATFFIAGGERMRRINAAF